MLQHAMSNFPCLNAKDIERILLKAGFEIESQKGSHKQFSLYKNGKLISKVTVPFHGTKDLTKGTVNSIIRQSGLGKTRFYALLVISTMLKFIAISPLMGIVFILEEVLFLFDFFRREVLYE